MKVIRLFFLLLCVVVNAREEGFVLPFLGSMPRVPTEWKLLESGTNNSSGFAFSWLILTNVKSGDLLSFSAETNGTNDFPAVNRVPWSDLVGDRFPGGQPGWKVAGEQKFTAHWIRNEVVPFYLTNRQSDRKVTKKALEYSLVYESADNEPANRLAHGYAIQIGKLRLIAQHTSAKPITPELAYSMITEMAQSALEGVGERK